METPWGRPREEVGQGSPWRKALGTYVGMAKETFRSPSPRTVILAIAIFSSSFSRR